jgi:hypothetical protein
LFLCGQCACGNQHQGRNELRSSCISVHDVTHWILVYVGQTESAGSRIERVGHPVSMN